MPRTALLTAGLTAALLLSACAPATDERAVQAPPVTPATSSPAGPAGATGTPTGRPVPTTAPAPPAPVATTPPKPRPPSYDVRAVQTGLRDLGYYVAAIDGEPGGQLRSAVMAFQKVNGLNADGTVGPKTLAALKRPRVPRLEGTGGGTRVEVDLTRQVMYVVKDGKVTRIMPVSSGSGERYRTKSGFLATALSPVGYYTIERRIIGVREADLGTLYDPQYFYKGWAIHGSNSVPAYPASHGCTRVTRADAKWLLGQIGVGTRVYFYGGEHVFQAGSAAPGTDDPGGDTTATPAPAPTSTATAGPTPSSTPSNKPSPTAKPTRSGKPSPEGTPTP